MTREEVDSPGSAVNEIDDSTGPEAARSTAYICARTGAGAALSSLQCIGGCGMRDTWQAAWFSRFDDCCLLAMLAPFCLGAHQLSTRALISSHSPFLPPVRTIPRLQSSLTTTMCSTATKPPKETAPTPPRVSPMRIRTPGAIDEEQCTSLLGESKPPRGGSPGKKKGFKVKQRSGLRTLLHDNLAAVSTSLT
jgi:hypothetical protein